MAFQRSRAVAARPRWRSHRDPQQPAAPGASSRRHGGRAEDRHGRRGSPRCGADGLVGGRRRGPCSGPGRRRVAPGARAWRLGSRSWSPRPRAMAESCSRRLARDRPKRVDRRARLRFRQYLCAPDTAIATSPGRLDRRLGFIADAAALEPLRLLKSVLAYAGLSAAWILGEGRTPNLVLAVAAEAAARL